MNAPQGSDLCARMVPLTCRMTYVATHAACMQGRVAVCREMRSVAHHELLCKTLTLDYPV